MPSSDGKQPCSFLSSSLPSFSSSAWQCSPSTIQVDICGRAVYDKRNRQSLFRRLVHIDYIAIYTSTKPSSIQTSGNILGEGSESKNLLDGCRHVYLDMGTNTGIQIRKLYEPHLFPNASVLSIFDKFFGPIGERFSSIICLYLDLYFNIVIIFPQPCR